MWYIFLCNPKVIDFKARFVMNPVEANLSSRKLQVTNMGEEKENFYCNNCRISWGNISEHFSHNSSHKIQVFFFLFSYIYTHMKICENKLKIKWNHPSFKIEFLVVSSFVDHECKMYYYYYYFVTF